MRINKSKTESLLYFYGYILLYLNVTMDMTKCTQSYEYTTVYCYFVLLIFPFGRHIVVNECFYLHT